MIDADKTTTATNIAHSISVLDAINYMLVAWKEETIQIFFQGLTPAVLDEPFLEFSYEEISATLM